MAMEHLILDRDTVMGVLDDDPILFVALGLLVLLSIVVAVPHALSYKPTGYEQLNEQIRFCYGCFIKPHDDSGNDQKAALESFYGSQATVYDSTRKPLLRGREDMLGIVAAQLQCRIRAGAIGSKPIWVDVGGGTGYNIEQMSQFVDVTTFFEKIFLVDLSPSLTAVAKARFLQLGWKNVVVVCQDARSFHLQDYYGSAVEGAPIRKPDLITLSYSLSMIPDYYSVVDSLASSLATNGVIGVVDFYVQNAVEYHSRNYIGGDINRHCMWISRVFWRAWFEADRVNLEAARRDYLEYRFGTILSFNERCRLLGFRIPYYVWIGCSKHDGVSSVRLNQLNAQATESPFISALDLHSKSLEEEHEASAREIRSKAYESAVINLAASIPLPASWYQQHHWRIYYDDSLQKHRQFGDEYIYAFTWEDAQEDARLLEINSEDVILAITSAGDNILAYALQSPKRIHAVDLNPNQNHLLELKLACFTALGHADMWALFGQGKHSSFRELLISRLSPHLSSLAFQYWLHHGPRTFDETSRGIYLTGRSRHALNLVSWLSHVFGLRTAIKDLCSAQTLEEQRRIWKGQLRPILLNRWLSRAVLSNKAWLWRALGVPQAQRDMIEEDHATQLAREPQQDALSPCTHDHESRTPRTTSKSAIWSYCAQTLDPVAQTTHLRTSNHYYLLTLLGHYTQENHPAYLAAEAHVKLSAPHAFDGLRIHTDEMHDVLGRLQPASLTIAVVMDSFDWFERVRSGRERAAEQVRLLRLALVDDGRVLLRSAGRAPWYIELFESQGFEARRVGVRAEGSCMDRVNMYASTWICTKRKRERTPSLDDSRSTVVQPRASVLDALDIGSPSLGVDVAN